jgi:uncharacterized membrane protein
MMPPGAMVPPPGGGVGPIWTPMEAYSFAWKVVTKRFATAALPLVVGWLVMALIFGVVYGGTILGPQMLVQQGVVDGSMALVLTYASIGGLSLIIVVVQAYMMGGILTVTLKAARGQPTAVGEIFAGGRFFVPFLVGIIAQQILVGIGYVLCFVPGVILLLGLWAWGYIVVDQGMGAVDALKKSWEMMKGHKMAMFVWGLLSILVYVAGELACVLPVLLISLPMVFISSAWIYLRLKGEVVSEPT